MGMTPSRRKVEQITLGDLAADGRIVFVRCNLCQRTSYFLASDLVRVYGRGMKMHDVFHQCSRCRRSQFIHVGTRLPNGDDLGRLKVRRPHFVRVVWSWREVSYEDPKRRPQTAREFIARSRENYGMGHNYEETYTAEQSSILTMLHNKGFWAPNFATRQETLDWIEQNRWRVEKPPKGAGEASC